MSSPPLSWPQRLLGLICSFLVCLPPVGWSGDILRQGAPAGQRPDRTSALDAATAAAAARARASASDAMARTSRAISAVQAMQTAARAAAEGARNLGADPNHPGVILPDVPDGLAPGGLEVAGELPWTGAALPVQNETTVTVQQTEQQAILNWRTFNIGRNTTLAFDQSAGGEQVGTWVAFNKVNDPSGRPSQILGSITAKGQVYVINQNGIIFGGTSQVNTHTLVASSLPINDNLIANGLLNNPDGQFLFSALPLPAGAQGTPGFTPPPASTPDGRRGDVTVQAGAQLIAPTSEDKVGGRIALIGANVKNSGMISTADGQTILAAGLQVGFDAHDSNDATLRGLDVFVGAVSDPVLGDYAGRVTNDGFIEAYRGSVTLVGKSIDHLGGINSSTSVALNGRVDLLANYNSISNDTGQGPLFLPRSTGTVRLGPASVVQILPEWNSGETAVGVKLPLRSQVNIRGFAVYLGEKSTIYAPNAQVSISAGIWDFFKSVNEGKAQFLRSGGQIYVDRGAMISVAGSTDVNVALSQYILSVVLRGAELADSPVQRTGPLRGPSITVDLRKTGTFGGRNWVGTPLADLSGFLGLVERSAGQLSAEGGSVSISAGESVIIQNGSIIDVSGGFANVEGGFVQTTRIMQGGRLVDVADATPDQVYDGIYTGKFNTGSARWGVSETYTVPWMTGKHYEKGYVEGAAGGAIDITAPSMALDGTLRGHTVVGERQREANPVHSELSLEFTAETVLKPNSNFSPFPTAPTPPVITFQSGAFQEAADPFLVDESGNPNPLRADRKAEVFLSPELLTTDGFGELNVENSDGDVYVPNNVALIAPAVGSITLSGKNIDVQGTLSAPAGAITLNVFNISPYLLQVTSDEPALDRGNFVLGGNSSLNVAGLLIDDRFSAPYPLSQPLGVNVRDEDGDVSVHSTLQGGSVAINSFNADLIPGSVIDASGGVWMTARSKRNYGDGGSISIKAGKDPRRSIVGGRLTLGSELRGYSGATGGSLTLQAPIIQVGGAPVYENTLLLQPKFFSTGGFTEFTLIGIGADLTQPGDLSYAPAVTIAPGTVIEPVAESILAIPHVRGSDTFGLRTLVKPVGYRTPVSLNFETVEGGIKSVVDDLLKVRGDIVMGEGSRIVTDPLGHVSFKAQTVAILGSITAPGGSIQVIGATGFPSRDIAVEALPTVYLGPSSRLSTKGTAIYLADRFNRRTGYVLPGGTISVAGNIVADEGALLDVSGTSAEFDVHPAYLNLNATASGLLEQLVVPFNSGITMPLYHSLSVPHQVDSDGGSIRLEGGELLHTRATLRGFAGGPSAIGGKLLVSSGYFGVADDRRINLTVAQDINTLPIPVFPAGQSPIGQPLRDAAGAPIPGQGYFGVNHFISSGLDALTLDGNVEFRGPVDLPARGYLKVGLGGVIQADSEVNLSAPYVAIGRPFQTPFLPSDNRILFEGTLPDNSIGPVYLSPTFGTGVLNIIADQIDIGTLSLQGIGEANFYATNDIRGNGTLNIAGRLTLTAGQIYPTTASAFTISAYDYVEGGVAKPGVVWIGSSGVNRDVPLSAGGQLNIFASVINQGGVLRAPIGSINLGWDGQGTAPIDPLTNAAVPVSQQLTLASGSITSVSAVNSLTGEASIIPYGLVVDGGVSWIDPTGLNITAGGVAQKSVRLSAGNLITEPGSLIDLSGGGDLLAYSFIKGNGGSTDILASEGSFAVIPGYDSNAAPYAPFNDNDVFASDPGYVNGTLRVGDRIFLSGSDALRAGHYTLLPARYALLPGAVLVTPQEGMPIGTFKNADGSFFVSGYRYNDLNSSRNRSGLLYSRFEVASAEVFNQRAKYETFFANDFLEKSAIKVDAQVPRLPKDGGYLLFQSTQGMSLLGSINARGAQQGRAGLIDINTPIDILISGAGAKSETGKLVLDASLIEGWGAESVLIGGARTFGVNQATVRTSTRSITVNNAGTPLRGSEIILTSLGSLTLSPGAQIEQTGSIGGSSDLLIFGDANVPGSGNGTMLRVSSDPNAEIFRNSVNASTQPSMVIGAGASISGTSVILDSTYATYLDPNASIIGRSITLNSGQISIQLDNPGTLQPTVGLVLGGPALQGLQSAQALSFLSYSTLDVYGTGGFTSQGALSINAASIRGFNNGGGQATFKAGEITLGNRGGGTDSSAAVPVSGTLAFDANTIRLSSGQLSIKRYADTILSAPGGILATGSGLLQVQGNLTANTSLITSASSATHGIIATGVLSLLNSGTPSAVSGGLGGSLTFQGSSINAGSSIVLPSGLLSMRSTSGPLTIGGLLDVGGTQQSLFDLVRYTDGGSITLTADNGDVQISGGGVVNVAAQAGAGDAGKLIVEAPNGAFVLGGSVFGQGGIGGVGGSFELDAKSIPSFGGLTQVLNNGAFTESRIIRQRTGNVLVDVGIQTQNLRLSLDAGSITVASVIDASGDNGGTIDLKASGSVTLQSGAVLNASGQTFSNAGKGGAVYLEAGSQINGVINTAARVDVQTGSLINLTVGSQTASSASAGLLSGSLHIRAPQVAAFNELQITPLNGTILGASKIEVEGYRLFDLTGTGIINPTVQTNVRNNGNTFGAAINAITNRILASNAGLAPVLVVMPGAEIINRTGNLTLGTSASSFAVNDWNLATFRFGPKSAPGVLTLRAFGDLAFYNALSDGFDTTRSSSTNALERLWTAPLLFQNPLLPVNAQSWSYRLASGADFAAADFHEVRPLETLAANVGSILIGQNAGQATVTGGANALTQRAINPNNATNASSASNRFQVVRTGSGDIDVVSGRDVQLLNQFATIYTAGTQVADPTRVFTAGDFVTPIVTFANAVNIPNQGPLGAQQQQYLAQYSMAGGNVTVAAQSDIRHLTRDPSGNLITDSSRQLPTNWLYRRGYVDPTTGQYGASGVQVQGSLFQVVNDPASSTTWWINFSNFFSGVGALGGGNVTITAGRDIENIDAHATTNARAPIGIPEASKILELGGGDLTVKAGRNIDAGVYYVERGLGRLNAGAGIVTNSTRSPTLGRLQNVNNPNLESNLAWLPTTLFAGKSQFEVSARGDVLLGPVANPFWLPQGLNNRHWYKTYFNTYSRDSGVSVSSLGGSVTLRTSAVLRAASNVRPLLEIWGSENQVLSSNSAANLQPWLRIVETTVGVPFNTLYGVMPASLDVFAPDGNINLAGDVTLFPSPRGNLNFLAKGAISGLQPVGISSSRVPGALTTLWSSSTVNLSDANSASLPGVTSPFAYFSIVGRNNTAARTTTGEFLLFAERQFIESGSSTGRFGTIQSKQALHAPGILHKDDFNPVSIYAGDGSISGLTLFSPKKAQIFASSNITDVSFYIQNVRDSDVSVVSSGRDIVIYNPNSPLRVASQTGTNLIAVGEVVEAGDIQISGPGTLQVLAGRDLDLGSGANNADGTGVGIVSIGNARNPALPFEGADIIAAAGLGGEGGLASRLDFEGFIDEIITGANGTRYLSELNDPLTLAAFEALSPEEQYRRALQVFFLALRDAGRDRTALGTNYEDGFAAIDALFQGDSGVEGNMSLTSRQIKTRAGGDISLLIPQGKLSVGIDRPGGQSLEQGILTERGGNISIFAKGDVDLGTSRIFTLRGGDIMIWSSEGDIAAGASSKTVQSAPPTRVIIDPQSGNVATDLSGLATGGGIGVLDTVAGVPPGNVDLIAVMGVVDAGDAGIRSSGNLNIAATAVLNASNIAVAGASTGTPAAPVVAAPNIGGLASASAAAGSNATAAAAATQAANQPPPQNTGNDLPSIITVEVQGYGGGEGDPDQEDEEEKKKKKQAGTDTTAAPAN